jgi:hypothetical protein
VRVRAQVSIEGRPLNYKAGNHSKFVGLDDEVCSVEQLALQHYAAEYGDGKVANREIRVWHGATEKGP